MSFFSKLFLSKDKTQQYEAEKKIALSGDVKERMNIAKNADTHPEILFYMAQSDGDANVRTAVAHNPTTPVQVSGVLSKDKSEDVRLVLCARLVKLLPDLSPDKQSQLYKFAIEALGNLALDEVIKVRKALSTALLECTDAPPQVVGVLARDVEREVSEPILRFCTALSDEDLLDILKSHPASWAVQAVASRPLVAAPVSQAVINTNDSPAGKLLLENKGATISVETLQEIVKKSREFPEWQKPLAMKKNLPPHLAKELAGFVDLSVRNLLLERTDFDGDTLEDITKIVGRRIDFMMEGADEPTEKRVLKLYQESKLTSDMIADALSMKEWEFVLVALAVRAKTTKIMVDKILAMGAAKPIVALCWKADMSMRFALRMQHEMAKIPHKELVYPRGGTDYPLTEDEIKWQLDFLGV